MDNQRLLLWQALSARTQTMIETGQVPKPLNNRFGIVDVSLNSGHPDLQNNQSDFPLEMCTFLSNMEKQISERFTFLTPNPSDSSHMTLFTLWNGRKEEILAMGEKRRIKEYRLIMNLTRKFGSFDVTFDRINLAPNGSLLLQGRSDRLQALRILLDRKCPSDNRKLQNIAHITLARSTELISLAEFKELFKWVSTNGGISPYRIIVRKPILVAVSDLFGLNYNEFHMDEINACMR